MGTHDTHHEEVLDFLKKNTCDNLILNGDIIDRRFLRYFPKYPTQHKKAIEYIFQLANENRTKITYIQGNHEKPRKNIFPMKINNIVFADEIIYQSGNKKFLVCHGQQFDNFQKGLIWAETICFWIGMAIFRFNRKINKRRLQNGYSKSSLVQRIKRLAKLIAIGGKSTFEKRVIKTLQQKNCDGLICGHLHKPEISYIKEYNYLNSGDRVEELSALVETENHERKLVYYKDLE